MKKVYLLDLSHGDEEYCMGFIANTMKDARKMAWISQGIEYENYIEMTKYLWRVRNIDFSTIQHLPYGEVAMIAGLKYGVYANDSGMELTAEYPCEKCGAKNVRAIGEDGVLYCLPCYDKANE